MIQLSNVSKYYHNNGVTSLGLKGINLTLNKGEIVAIIGESGAGKSTLLNVICGVDSYDDGEMYFNGEETSYFNIDDMDNYRKSNVSFIYQNYNIIESYTVLQNVSAPLLLKGMSKKEAEAEAKKLIEEVGLTDRINNKGTHLSGGEKQRCVIARALATDSPILACDEPTGNLDSKTGDEIIELIHKVSKDKLVLIVTHNYAQVENIVTRTLRLHDGEIVEDIVKTPVPEENIQEKPVTEEKKKKKSTFRSSITIAVQNILAAPKKSVFISIVLVILSAIMLFSLTSDFYSASSVYYDYSTSYYNTLKNRLVVYNKDHSKLDTDRLDEISGDKINNGWYEDKLSYFDLNGNISMFSYSSGSCTCSTHVPELADSTGKTEYSKLANTESILVFTSKSDFESAEKNIDLDTAEVTTSYDDFDVVGIGYNTDLKYPLLVSPYFSTDSSEGCFLFPNSFTITGKINGEEYDFTYNYEFDEKATEPTLTLYDTSMTASDFSLTIGDLYTFPMTPKIEQAYDNLSEVSLTLPQKFNTDDVYECTIYADNLSDAKKKLTSLGYSYSETAKGKENKSSIAYISMVFSIFMTVVYGILVTLVAYVILNKTYSSRIKDFTVLRSLGYLKKQMKGIVSMEMAIYGLFSSALALLLFWIVSLFVPYLSSLLSYLSVWMVIVYLLVIQLYSYIIAQKFNKKVFKFTVTENLRNGGLL